MRPRGENVEYDKLRDRYDAHAAKVAALEADRDLLSQKACEAVLHYRTALGKLTDSFKYSTEVVTIAREALAHSTSITSENKRLREQLATELVYGPDRTDEADAHVRELHSHVNYCREWHTADVEQQKLLRATFDTEVK